MDISSPFVFATCRAGSESVMKDDVASRQGKLLRPAFMRPQFITWKCDELLGGSFNLDCIYARVSGLSLGMCRTFDEVLQKLAPFSEVTFHLHVFPRETPEDGVAMEKWEAMDQVRVQLMSLIETQGMKTHPVTVRPKNGDWIVDVMVGEKDEPILLGAHQHSSGRHTTAGALPRLELPPGAPSRAWLKLEQALAFAGWSEESLSGSVAVELGCAPGGASLALLQHGMKVIGVDTAPMDSVVLDNPRFKHLRMSAGALSESFLPDRVDMLVSDMNLAPPVALHYLDRVQKRVRASRMIITLKINDGEMEARIHESLKQLRRMAPHPMRVTQLPANRREICVVAGS